MKTNYFIAIIFAVILATIIGFQFLNRPDENQNTQTPTISEIIDSNLDELKSQTSSEGSVTVSVTPHKSASEGVWEFEITLDTHSVELDDDLTKAVILIADDKEHKPLAWNGDSPSGHHRKGVLQFAPISPQPKSITLKIFQVGEIEERNFIWKFK